MTTHRTYPPAAADEATTLLAFLDYQRDTLRRQTEGLDGDDLRRTVVAPALRAWFEAHREEWAPTEADVEHARGLITAFEAGIAEGKGVVTYNGRMIENLHVANAQRLLAVADAIAALGS